jgi:MYXO-CTERM domain-containing protein
MCVALLLLVLPTTGLSQTHDDPFDDGPSPCVAAGECTQRDQVPSIDPMFGLIESLQSRPASPPTVLDELTVDGGVSTLLRFERYPTADARQRLAEAGIIVDWAEGQPRLGDVYEAIVPLSSVDVLSTLEGLQRAEVARRPGQLSPLTQSTDAMGLPEPSSRSRMPAGEGVTIAMIDSPVDIMHPSFFRADGTVYPWTDVNGDDALTPGVDGIDLDDSGSIEDDERLRLLEGATQTDDGDVDGDDGAFDIRRDWLYLDTNNDRIRNAGPSAGYDESDPTYGEPLFVWDDVDGDGRTDPAERLVALDSSKIRRMVTDSTTYRRGDNLFEAGDIPWYDLSRHATAVAGILAADDPRYHNAAGLAPESDLLVYGRNRGNLENSARHLQALRDALDRDADVVLHEWSNPFFRPLDGSTNLDHAIESAHEDGVPQVIPVGNLNESGKNIVRDVTAGTITRLPFQQPGRVDVGSNSRAVHELFGILQWSTSETREVSLQSPSGDLVEITLDDTADSSALSIENSTLRIVFETTAAGTQYFAFILTADNPEVAIAPGTWLFRTTAPASNTKIIGRISDRHTGWSEGVGWQEPTSNESTASYPAAADGAIGVGAMAARPTPDIPTLRGFSGRGPFLRGDHGVDLVAPDNPYTPSPSNGPLSAQGQNVWYQAFGGTSGAAPHVAGALAILRDFNPGADGRALVDTLFSSAARQGLSPSPDEFPANTWGYGRLTLQNLVPGAMSGFNNRPVASVDVLRDGDNVILDASESQDPNDDPIEFRYDVNYDGQWETGWVGRAQYTFEAEPAPGGRRIARVAVRDARGAEDGDIVEFTVEDSDPSDPGDTDVSTSDPDTGLDAGNSDSDAGLDAGPTELGDLDPNARPPSAGCSAGTPDGSTPLRIDLAALLLVALGAGMRQYKRR